MKKLRFSSRIVRILEILVIPDNLRASKEKYRYQLGNENETEIHDLVKRKRTELLAGRVIYAYTVYQEELLTFFLKDFGHSDLSSRKFLKTEIPLVYVCGEKYLYLQIIQKEKERLFLKDEQEAWSVFLSELKYLEKRDFRELKFIVQLPENGQWKTFFKELKTGETIQPF